MLTKKEIDNINKNLKQEQQIGFKLCNISDLIVYILHVNSKMITNYSIYGKTWEYIALTNLQWILKAYAAGEFSFARNKHNEPMPNVKPYVVYGEVGNKTYIYYDWNKIKDTLMIIENMKRLNNWDIDISDMNLHLSVKHLEDKLQQVALSEYQKQHS